MSRPPPPSRTWASSAAIWSGDSSFAGTSDSTTRSVPREILRGRRQAGGVTHVHEGTAALERGGEVARRGGLPFDVRGCAVAPATRDGGQGLVVGGELVMEIGRQVRDLEAIAHDAGFIDAAREGVAVAAGLEHHAAPPALGTVMAIGIDDPVLVQG